MIPMPFDSELYQQQQKKSLEKSKWWKTPKFAYSKMAAMNRK